MTDENPSEEPWVIADMLPIAVAHAEAAAKAAGISVGEWLAQLIVAGAPAPETQDSDKPPVPPG